MCLDEDGRGRYRRTAGEAPLIGASSDESDSGRKLEGAKQDDSDSDEVRDRYESICYAYLFQL